MKTLVVSLHDVSPLTQSASAQILAELTDFGIEETSLLVIPNHHHRASVRDDLGFQDWLTGEVNKGHEPVLHGYFHQREGRVGGSWRSKAVTEFYTAGEGEFFDLTEQEASIRLQNGLADLAFLPRKISGFIAPAWLLGHEAEKAVRAFGFSYTTRAGTVRAFRQVPDVRSRSLVWSTRASWRAWMSLRWNATLARLVNRASLVRMGIHPPDYAHQDVWRQIKLFLTRLKADRVCVSYENFIAHSVKLDSTSVH